ncbi:ribonuclease III domain-containing protein [uncultured Methanomethylovorans sp.]|uniref:ribonuclease III domain-containing protein n=1 Tax=uncultured Methanomethylovorans sp. TaxID=183759 RepID=UPI002AA907BD|nr:ribonuclease III domain-containing protein [uncultured Methanomethylovorans sp.]
MDSKIICESDFKLRWNVQGLFDNFSVIRNELELQFASLPANNTRKQQNLVKWINQIKKIEDTVHYIKTNKIKEIEKNLDYKFIEPDFVVIAFFQPDSKNLFAELKSHYSKTGKNFDFEPYLNLDEAAKVLAWIGDSAINLATTHVIRQPYISKVGELAEKRAELVSNKHQANLCDEWNLFDLRLGFTTYLDMVNEDNIKHAKATIIEALFGVIYIESGFDKVISSAIYLKRFWEFI